MSVGDVVFLTNFCPVMFFDLKSNSSNIYLPFQLSFETCLHGVSSLAFNFVSFPL